MYINIFANLFVAVFGFIASYFLLKAYVYGDMAHYQKFYDGISGIGFFSVRDISLATISSNEPLSLFVLWVGSNLGIDRLIWVSFLNVLLLIGLLNLLAKYKASVFVIILFFSNFYLLVLMTGAERLKIAYIFLIWSCLISGRSKYLLAALSPLAHFQTFILYFSILLSTFDKNISNILFRGIINLKNLFILFVPVSFLFLIILLFRDGVQEKLDYSSVSGNPYFFLFNILLLLIIGLFVLKNRFSFILAFIPFFVAAFMFGGFRVNMIAVTYFLGQVIFNRKLSKPIVLILLIYFSSKSYLFLYNIFAFGNGFGGPLF